jgi:nucleoid-associated protein YgaU
MGRDKVLGLSLAILLIGFAGAFCFRNEPLVQNGLKLAKAKILDEGIAQRSGPKPYLSDPKSDPAPPNKPAVTLGGIEAIDTPESPKMAQRSDRNDMPTIEAQPKSSSKTPKLPRARIEHLVSEQKQQSMPEPVSTEPGPTAGLDQPLQLTIRPNSPAFASPDSLLEESGTWQHRPEGHDGCPAMTGTEHDNSTLSDDSQTDDGSRAQDLRQDNSAITYRVRRGDTLTKIAQHFLGDNNRYREIFEANRDLIPSVNARLKVGMTLQIPGDRARSKRSTTTTTSKSKSTRSNDAVGESTRPREVLARPASRSKVLPTRQRTAEDPAKSPSADEPQESMGPPRFVPVSKAPFLRGDGSSSSINSRSRDLSQRPPAVEGDKDHRSESNSSDKDQTPSSKQESDGSGT